MASKTTRIDPGILRIIEQSAAVPTMPQIVTRFIELSADPEYDLDDLVELLGSDPGITTELLRMTNSALFGLSRKVTSLSQAVALLGMARVRTLVLGRYLVDRLSAIGGLPDDFSYAYYWRRSLTQAVLASRLTQHLAPALREEAFVAGLLADSGVIMLGQSLPKQYRPLLVQYAPLEGWRLWDQELAALGITHADVSALVLERWMLPEAVVLAVRGHHDVYSDETPADDSVTLARVVGAADIVAKLLCEKPEPETLLDRCREALNEINLNPVGLARILEEMQDDIVELADLLGVEIIHSRVYSHVIEVIRQQLTEQPVA